MKAIVVSATRRKGFSKKNGNPYDICRVSVLRPVEPRVTDQMHYTGVGFEVSEYPLDPACLPSFESLKFPAHVDLSTEARDDRGRLELVVIGVETPQKVNG